MLVVKGKIKNKIIVCGYPKSGNTWLTKLTAELVDCPYAGFWCAPFHATELRETVSEKSNRLCFKAHHTIEQLMYSLDLYGNGSEKIIYIHRDPRAIAVSAAHFFSLQPRCLRIRNLFSLLPKGLRLYRELFHSHRYKIDVFVKGIVEGTKQNPFLETPWEEHVKAYKDRKDILFLGYESLLKDTCSEAVNICNFLNISRSEDEINKAIHEQSFETQKRRYEQNGDVFMTRFLRRGENESWREELEERHLKYIEEHIGDTMKELGYTFG